ncbi:MAG: transcriptional activator NhaR [Candidatus Sericytochromatia bacterium]|nr:transcriptional activator NhaR [Candidatus Sericytochromatia bacterium]
MEWLNYHHLLYFWVVAREGSVTKASQVLHLAQPTISAQLRSLEESLGEPHFSREGRGLVLTETGHMVYRYASEIFAIGQEMLDALKTRPVGRPLKLHVGVATVVPNLVAHQLLSSAYQLPVPVQIICQHDTSDRLLASLAMHELDLVLTDAPIGPGVKVRAYNHVLGECEVGLFGTPALAARYQEGFPRSLHQAPMLLPTAGTSLRRALDQWFDSLDIKPQIVGEFADSALMKAFALDGLGVFALPVFVGDDLQERYGFTAIGRIEGVKERFYAISAERRLKHPAVIAITNAGRQILAGQPLSGS